MKMTQETPISHVTDTATWVANYRADETKRPDALFKDPLASRLIDEKGAKISENMVGSEWVRWTVVIRTVIIDQFISELVAQGVDTILNLGAGLDTRPYRMNLPEKLKWIEVDYPKTIQLKENKLKDEKPKCQLERYSIDLANREERLKLFSKINAESKKVLVLTEGLIPYLTEQHVAELAQDLRAQKNFKYWIAEYIAPHLYSYFNNKKRKQQMRNAPFLFFPKDWYGHFEKNGWKAETTRYSAIESEKVGRAIPFPWWAFLARFFMSRDTSARFKKFSGYILFTPK